MDLSRIRALRGPNLWSRLTAIEAVVKCQPHESDLGLLPGFEARLRQRFPELLPIPTNPGEGPVSLAHALESVSLSLQIQAGTGVTFSHTAAAPEPGVYQVVVQYTEEAVGRQAMAGAKALIDATLHDTPFDVAALLHTLREIDEDERLGPSTGSIVQAAVARGIPYRRLTKGSLVQFGWGSKQRRIQAAECDSTSAIAEGIAQDKELTKKLLHAAGVPVPMGTVVSDADAAWRAAQALGLPVVLKPQDGNQGKGVSVNLSTEHQVRAAYQSAAHYGSDVIVERFLPGLDYRLLVVGHKLIAASRRDPPLVVGDGVHTIEQLVTLANQDPRRGDGHSAPMTKMRIDDIARERLREQGLTPMDVPALGARVSLRNNANLSTGGSATDVTDEVHPDVAARAVAAATMVGLDICGVDVVCNNVLEPLEKQGGGVVEVNAAPGLRMHISPSFGKGRAVGEAVIDHMFAPGDDGRIPVVAVTGTNGKTTTVRLTSHLLHTHGWRVGMTNTDGVYVNGRQTDSGDCSGPKSARNVLMHPDVDAAVFETARGGLLREGLAYDKCKVAVVTNIGEGDHLGLNYIVTLNDLRVLKRVIVLNLDPSGMAVLNAMDPEVVKMAPFSPAEITYFARNGAHPVLVTHRAQGKRVVYVDGSDIVCQAQGLQTRIPLSDVPLTRNGTIGFQIDNAMASIGAAWALGLPWETIRQGLRQFVSDAMAVPGRFNLFDYKGATLIADYGHNPDAIQALCDAVQNMGGGKRVVVISGAGDRRDEDIRNQTQILGGVFDEVVLYQDACQRGRADGEVLALLQEGLQGAQRTTWIDTIQGEFNAIDAALARLSPGDLCLILIDQVEEALAHIKARCA